MNAQPASNLELLNQLLKASVDRLCEDLGLTQVEGLPQRTTEKGTPYVVLAPALKEEGEPRTHWTNKPEDSIPIFVNCLCDYYFNNHMSKDTIVWRMSPELTYDEYFNMMGEKVVFYGVRARLAFE